MQGLYIHIPFCRRKCLYCDFYSVALEEGLAQDYTAAVKRNLAAYGGSFDSVYFGGGTPILLAEQLLEMLKSADVAQGAEITAECNPCEMTSRTLDVMLKSGINRISVGVQSFCDSELTALGRRHDSQTAIQAVKAAKAAGFDNISLDLMLGIPEQTADSLAKTLDIAQSLPITHISAYMLKIEENTPFGKSTPPLPGEDETADMYLQTVGALSDSGFEQYEISNFAKRGYECRHNLKYWHAEEYLGIGPAAHSYIGGRRFAAARDLAAFIAAEQQHELITQERTDEREERIMLGLRLSEGIPQELWKPLEAALLHIPKQYYRIRDGRLSLTAEGFLVSNEIISLLLAQL
ncbi:MAG: radical SAM family heme chaperone HemW [Oscillospiraceae bacterium]